MSVYMPTAASLFDNTFIHIAPSPAQLDMIRRNCSDLKQAALNSLPLKPLNAAQIQTLIVEESESDRDYRRERAYYGCEHLIQNGHEEGYNAAECVASKKLRHSEVKMRQEGLEYFTLLLQPRADLFKTPKFDRSVLREDLDLALEVASLMYHSGPSDYLKAQDFFDGLIKHREGADVAELEPFLLGKACDSQQSHMVYNLCETITRLLPCNVQLERYYPMLKRVALKGVESDDKNVRSRAFTLFGRLLSEKPVETIDALMHSIDVESKRPDPCLELHSRLQELAGHEVGNLMRASKEFIKDKENAHKFDPLLLKALTHLAASKNPYWSKRAEKLKTVVEERMNKAIANNAGMEESMNDELYQY